MQNPSLGAICLWAFVLEFWTQTGRNNGPSVAMLSCVLPITFHRESVESLHSRRYDGGLLNALAEDRCLTIGLQDRMEEMIDQTFEALQMAVAAKLLKLDTTDFSVLPERLTAPDFTRSAVHNEMMATSTRLGHWFATLPFEQVCNYLRIRF